MTDPYVHHPELRGRITPAEDSFFRGFTLEALLTQHPEMEARRQEFHTDTVREALRAEALAGHAGDLWVFAYGSLIWDPALRFAEVRRATIEGYSRRFILRVDGGRGSPEAPGLMAALDDGTGCEGLAFRIAAETVDAETEILFRREMLGKAYLASFVPVRFGDGGTARALTFLADHDSPDIHPDLSRADTIRYIATGAGILGTSRDYLANIVGHFEHLGIEDPDCTALLREVDAWIAAHPQAEAAP